jgi:hypothetical protein
MDKANQIKEMAKIISDTWLVNLDGDTFNVSEFLDKVDIESIATELNEYGYRKINENEVIISKDNYNRLKRDSELYEARHKEKLKLFEKAYNQGCKETAEKILREFEYCNDTTFYSKWLELCKQFGVDLGE